MKDKEASNQNENAEVFREHYNKVDEFVPEAGLAKNRMKQYLETASSQKVQQQSQHQTSNNTNIGNGEEQPEKGTARSLLAKWKSIENLKDKETSPELGSGAGHTNGTKQTSPFNGVVVTDIETTGMAKNLLNKWENLENDRSPAQTNGTTNGQHSGEEIAQIEKGFAKNVLAKYV